MRTHLPLILIALSLGMSALAVETPRSVIPAAAVEATAGKLLAMHGPGQAGRIRQGVGQVAARWWPQDGDVSSFEAFCVASFIADGQELARTAAHQVTDRHTR